MDENEIASELMSGSDQTAPVENTPEEKQPVTEQLMRSEMEKIFDRAQAEGEQKAAEETIPTVPAANIDEAFQRTADWMEKSQDEKATMKDAHGLVERLKTNAAQMGVKLDDTEALKMAFQIEQGGKAAVPAELTPAMESVKSLYGDQVPFHEAAQRYAQIDSLVRSDPAQGLSDIIRATGHDEREVLRQMAAKHAPQEWQEHFALRDLTVHVEAFLDAHPDADQPAMVEALARVPKSGSFGERLRAAYQMTKSRQSRGGKSRPKSMEARMKEAYEARQR